MNEHENDTRMPDQTGELAAFKPDGEATGKRKGDLVVDLSGITELDLASLSMLLTAQQKAEKEDRLHSQRKTEKIWQIYVGILDK